MKKFFLLTILSLLSFGVMKAQNPNTGDNSQNTPGPKIEFESLTHDYGTITKGSDGTCTFTFTNTGDEPLVLSNVRASCGCTTPSWTQKPVMPGKTGTITVRYNTNNMGSFNKSITVQSTAVNTPRVVLIIKGNVVAASNENQQ